MTVRQYILDFPVLTSHSTEDFVIGDCNRIAAEFISRWPDWPAHALTIAGEGGSGKSHLAKIFQEKSGADILEGRDLDDDQIPFLKTRVVIENADRCRDEKALLHLFNWTRDKKGSLLLTTRTAPSKWGLALPDLSSRLQAAPMARLERPEEDILSAAMAKQFSDRQIVVEDRVISFLIKRMDRSFPALREVVDKMDRLSLEEKARITVPLAKKALAAFGASHDT